MKFSIKDFFSKCDQIRNFLRIWSHFLKKSLMKNLFFYVVASVKNANFQKQFQSKSFTFQLHKKHVWHKKPI